MVDTGLVQVYTRPEDLEAIRAALEQEHVAVAAAEVTMVPKTTLELEDKAALQTLRLMDKLEELDEVQRVASNVDFSDDVLEKYGEQS